MVIYCIWLYHFGEKFEYFLLQVEYELAMKAVRDGQRVHSLVLLKENQKVNETTTLR